MARANDGGPRLGRRAALRMLGAVPLAAGLAHVAPTPTSWAQDGPSGTLAIPRGREVVLIAADGSGERGAASLPPGEFIADVALSPDGTLVAFGRFNTPAGGGPGGSDIILAPVDGSSPPRMVAERDGGGTLLAAPYFLPDGQSLLFEVVGLTGSGMPTVRTESVGVDGAGRQTVVENGRYPTVSADGRTLAYVKSLMTGDAIWTRPLGGGPERQVLSEYDLLLVAFPRFKPDGTTLLLAGVGDSARSPGKLLLGQAPPRQQIPAWAERTAGVAAHGLPVDPWLVNSDGANLQVCPALDRRRGGRVVAGRALDRDRGRRRRASPLRRRRHPDDRQHVQQLRRDRLALRGPHPSPSPARGRGGGVRGLRGRGVRASLHRA